MRVGPALAAEGAGTFPIVAASCAAALLPATWAPFAPLAIGAVVGLLIANLGRFSGAHYNPAVSLALALDRKVAPTRAAAYAVVQLAAALAGAAATFALAGRPVGVVVPGSSFVAAFAADAVATAVMVFTILAVVAGRIPKRWGAAAIGASVAIGIACAAPFSGASLNPARALAPALLAGQPAGLLVSALAPIAGAIIAFALHRIVDRNRAPRATPEASP